MESESRTSKVTTARALQLAAIVVAGFMFYEPLHTVIFLCVFVPGFLAYVVAVDEAK